MGMFDDVKCEYPLPNPAHQDLNFRTYDLGEAMQQYKIDKHGALWWLRGHWEGTPRFFEGMKMPYEEYIKAINAVKWIAEPSILMEDKHGDVTLYAGEGAEYCVRFTHGKVEWIKPVESA